MKDEKKRIIIYPFSEQSIAFVKYLERFNSLMTVQRIATEGGLFSIGYDASEIDHRQQKIGHVVEQYTDAQLDGCDVLVIPSLDVSDKLLYKKITDAIRNALSRSMEVYCGVILHDKEVNEFSISNCDKFSYLPSSLVSEEKEDDWLMVKPFYEPNAVVIFVGTVCIQDHVRESAFAIIDGLRRCGYRTTGIIQSCESALLGLHSMPSSLDFSKGVTADWIKKFNEFIREIDETEKPEVIIIELPGILHRYDDFIVGDYGLLPFAITQAVSPDFLHVCLPFDMCSPGLVTELSKICEGKFCHGIDSVHVSNVLKHGMESSSMMRYTHTHINSSHVRDLLNSFGTDMTIPMFDITGDEDVDSLCSFIIQKLS